LDTSSYVGRFGVGWLVDKFVSSFLPSLKLIVTCRYR